MHPEPVESEIDQHLHWPNLAAKAALLGLLMLGVIAGEWEQFQGKAMLPRALTYPLAAALVPLWWRLRRSPEPYPHLLDLLVVLPFLIDTAGNALNLYNTTEFFDRFAHWLNWAILVAAFGAIMSGIAITVLWGRCIVPRQMLVGDREAAGDG